MAYIQELTDESGESVYPVTKTNAVYDTNGHRLSDSMLTVGDPVEELEDIKINADSCNGVVLGIDGEGNRGYFEADGSFSPFNKPVLLWTNPNPINSSGFAAQTIALDLTNYEAVLVEIRESYTLDETPRTIAYIPKSPAINDTTTTMTIGRTSRSGSAAIVRYVTGIDDNGIRFGRARYGDTYGDVYNIPTRIYGLRTSFKLD